MNKSKYRFAVLLWLSLAAVSCIATAGLVDVQEGGVLWRYVYEGDVLPCDNLDAPFVLDRQNEDPVEEIVEDADNRILRQTITTGGWGWRISGPGEHLGKDAALMLEMRARIVSGSGFPLGVELRNGEEGSAALKVSTGSVVFGPAGGKQKTFDAVIGNEFHVYRITIDSSGAKLYLDGDPEPLIGTPVVPATGLWINFGNYGPLDGEGVVEYDYVKWTWASEASPPQAPAAN